MSFASERFTLSVIETIRSYMATLPEPVDPQIAPAMLSGMSLVADFLAKHDGHPTINAQFVAGAIALAGKQMGLHASKINDQLPPEQEGGAG